ncbi:hypothetical protein PstZobell_05208 [Stutzerimonas stutzeri ATCC 14405 = CCUG 16156]|uniref:hypothetical protein n=1 Tax=Stutzerimonas stutzeri TaxID=316 RepID=UPI0002548C81|nr:hypothetical protein [Stutzerimonas stutzeri]EHY76821.1 hypothetical protein PstZobell_05208 [Stutzerimonas stutzeri ATCC 14405 = CCUG 16156]QOZ95421.1 hypothetical protein Pstu14405_08740 [Stutzerimonas stutzeri]
MPNKTLDVFGVRVEPIASYIDRSEVDKEFRDGVDSDRQIIVYGSSKQGKTALVQKHLPYHDQIVIRLAPNTQVVDIYQSIVRQCNIKIITEQTDTRSNSATFSLGAKVKAIIPIFGSGEVNNENELQNSQGQNIRYEEIPFNLELAQDICELLKKINFHKFIILENFHYLPEEKQQQLAFDLRTFQEMGIRFVILGVWKEKNRLTQYNGDLDDRLKEISVEPWSDNDFERVAKKGSELLNIEFTKKILTDSIKAAFGSIGVFQELLKETCLLNGVTEEKSNKILIINYNTLIGAIGKKAKDYSTRHERSLLAISTGAKSYAPRQGQPPLYLPYYLAKAILSAGHENLKQGIDKSALQEKIRSLHYRPDDVRPGDVTYLLSSLASLQHKKGISPPIFDYNKEEKKLQIVDSTFFYYLQHADLAEFSESLPEPFGNPEMTGDLFSS